MKFKHFIALSILSIGFVFCGQNLNAQVSHPNDIVTFTNHDNANYDSLMNSYYFRKYSSSVEKHYKNQTNYNYSTFDKVPDSLLKARLDALPTIIPMDYNSDVRMWINTYIRLMSQRCDVMLTLSEFYFPMFEQVLTQYNVPTELKYLTIVESAMNPQATSRAGAAGLWQFMYTTGKLYGLEVNSLVDDRRDPYLSTVAAARHLRDLYKIFQDWELALAAYNCGAGGVQKALARAGGGKKTFWEIYNYLPRETRGYVPAFIGATYAMNYYYEHGIRPHKINIPISRDTVHLRQNATFSQISHWTGIDVAELRALNPQFRTDLVPVSAGRSSITLPSDKLSKFIRLQDSIYNGSRRADPVQPEAVTTTTTPQTNPTVASVATNKSSVKKQQPAKSKVTRVTYKVKKGDTLSRIAKKHGVTVQQIKKLNRMRSDVLREGQVLVIKG